jgi:hypothetical protein
VFERISPRCPRRTHVCLRHQYAFAYYYYYYYYYHYNAVVPRTRCIGGRQNILRRRLSTRTRPCVETAIRNRISVNLHVFVCRAGTIECLRARSPLIYYVYSNAKRVETARMIVWVFGISNRCRESIFFGLTTSAEYLNRSIIFTFNQTINTPAESSEQKFTWSVTTIS